MVVYAPRFSLRRLTGDDPATIVGRRRPVEPEALRTASEWLGTYRAYWEASFARLDDLLHHLQQEPE